MNPSVLCLVPVVSEWDLGFDNMCLFHTIEKKLREQVEQQLKRWQPCITRLVTKYNDLCKKLTAAIEHGSAPQHVIAPVPIDTRHLFSLDVDSELWNDAGLGMQDDNEQVPLWMRDEQVHAGI